MVDTDNIERVMRLEHDMKTEFSGELMFRAIGTLADGRKAILIFGVVAAPVDFKVKNDSTVRLRGYTGIGDCMAIFTSPPSKPVKEYAGWTAEDTIKDYKWRM